MKEPRILPSLLSALVARGERPAILAFRGENVESRSYAEVGGEAERLATGLVRAGVARGEPVALIGPNLPQWVIARLAIDAAGALAVPLDDLLGEAELATVLRDSGARRVFSARSHVAALRRFRNDAELEIYLLDGSGTEEGGERSWTELLAERAGPLPEREADSPSVLVYTSGTTGTPKGFTLSHANLEANLRVLLRERFVGPADRVLVPLPLHHVYPYLVGMLMPLASGAAMIFPEAVTGPKIVDALRAARATAIVGVPRLYTALLAGLEAQVAARGRAAAAAFHGLLALATRIRERTHLNPGRRLFPAVHARFGPDLRRLASGGARLEAGAVRALEGLGWEVFTGYGLAETASIFTANLPGRKRLGSEGRPLAGGELRIFEPDERGVGEIQLRGPNVFRGYRDPGETRAAFTEDGWFRTGDLGRLDADGYLYVTGRSKEMIVLGGGKNVFPEELERVYGESPYIREIAVLEREGALVALVLPDFESIRASASARVEDVLRIALTEISQRLPSFQRLAGVAIAREPLPRTRLGKFKRYLLAGLYEEAEKRRARPAPVALTEEDRLLLAVSPAREVWNFLLARYAGKPVTLEANPQLDLGIDSLEWVALALELENRYRVRLAEEQFARVLTVRDLLREVAAAGRMAESGAPAARAFPATARERSLSATGPALSLIGWSLYGVVWLIARLLFRLRLEGVGRLPASAPYVLVANHASDLDPFVLAAALPRRRIREVYWGGEVSRLFVNPVARLVSRAAHVFPVDERAPAATLDMASVVLTDGKALAWFPEMWRSPDGRLQRFLPGIGALLKRSGAPAVPVGISGTFEAMPRDRRVPRPYRVRVAFGRPVDPATLEEEGEGETPETRIANALRERVACLIRERDVG